MNPSDLAKEIKGLRARPPISTDFERTLDERGILDTRRAWYTSQKEDWLGWLAECEGAGANGRKETLVDRVF
jgi:hypothetical protein